MPATTSDLQHALHALWVRKRQDRPAPLRRDFDVVELRRWLGFLCLIDIEAGGEHFRHRIFGTSVADAVGHELTGRRLSEVEPEPSAGLLPSYRDVARSAATDTLAPHLRDASRDGKSGA